MIAAHYLFLKLGINSNQSLGQCFDIILIFFLLFPFAFKLERNYPFIDIYITRTLCCDKKDLN